MQLTALLKVLLIIRQLAALFKRKPKPIVVKEKPKENRKMTLSQKQRKFSKLLTKWLTYLHAKGYEITIGEVWRSPETQEIYVAQGKSQTRNSFHLNKLAFDFNLFVNGNYTAYGEDYRKLGEYWESLDPGCKWGGRFGVEEKDYKKEVGWDACHLEYG